jgi:hypothetical protein
MLREFGVKGVKIQEVVSLDEEMMAFLEYVGRDFVGIKDMRANTQQ